MLPVTCQFFIAMVAHAINERMARRLDYVQKEVRVLREALLTATGKTRIAFTAKQRQRLAIKGMTLPRTNVKAAFSSFDPRRS
jgi:methylglyoxal synthase